MGVLSVILQAIGGFSLIYYIVIVLVSGFKISFSGFWICIGIILIVIARILKKISRGELKVNRKVGFGATFLVILGISTFIIVEGKIIYSSAKSPIEGADYAIVLGAQVRGNVPSQSLALRIEGAVEYLKDNPKTLAIASGGKGDGENISEAETIKNGLVSNGIKEERIIIEDQSTSTVENIKFSKKLIDDEKAKIVIVTNNFHALRASMIAKKQGFSNISSLSVKSSPVITLNCYVREFFALAKDKVKGNI